MKDTLSKLAFNVYTHTTTPRDRSHQEKLGAVREDNDPLMRSVLGRSDKTIYWTRSTSLLDKLATPASESIGVVATAEILQRRGVIELKVE